MQEPFSSQSALGARLRLRRCERGLSLRQLTRQVGLTAHSNLADYEAGRRLPPQDVVAACEAALGIDGELIALREAALRERSTKQAEPAPAAPRRTRRAVGRGLAAVAVLCGAVLAGWRLAPRDTPAAAHVAVSSCDRGAVVLNAVPLVEPQPSARAVGTVTLRFSPACALGWARFIPTAAGSSTGTGLVLSVHRVSDGALTELRLRQVVAVESDPLLTVPGCVDAQAQITLGAGRVVSARTGCYQG